MSIRGSIDIHKELLTGETIEITWCRMVKTTQRVKTFATEQKMLLFTQIGILIGLVVQIGIFFSLLIWGRPPSTQYDLVLQFFLTAAFWVFTINGTTVLFWWISRLGPWVMAEEDTPQKGKTSPNSQGDRIT